MPVHLSDIGDNPSQGAYSSAGRTVQSNRSAFFVSFPTYPALLQTLQPLVFSWVAFSTVWAALQDNFAAYLYTHTYPVHPEMFVPISMNMESDG